MSGTKKFIVDGITIMPFGNRNNATLVGIDGRIQDCKFFNQWTQVFTIPKSVVYYGKEYRIVEIGSNAFRNNKSIRTIVCEGNISMIEAFAFANTNLEIFKNRQSHCVMAISAIHQCQYLKQFVSPSIGIRFDLDWTEQIPPMDINRVSITRTVKEISKEMLERIRKVPILTVSNSPFVDLAYDGYDVEVL